MSIQEQLQAILDDKLWKISELAWKLKTPEQTVRAWLKGTRVPDDRKFKRILKEAGL
jgi:DNA-binding transcriptional regulator YiaG